MDFVAIDFETANESMDSACAVGIVEVADGTITQRHSYLIRPPELHFRPFNTYIHGIRERDVMAEPTFDRLWEELRPTLENCFVVAHNARFDMSVLRSLISRYDLNPPTFKYLCTRHVAKRAWPALPNYKLKTVADHLGVRFRHHDAEEDALAAASIAIEGCQALGVGSIRDLCSSLGRYRSRPFFC